MAFSTGYSFALRRALSLPHPLLAHIKKTQHLGQGLPDLLAPPHPKSGTLSEKIL